jgi:hypothetical protein
MKKEWRIVVESSTSNYYLAQYRYTDWRRMFGWFFLKDWQGFRVWTFDEYRIKEKIDEQNKIDNRTIKYIKFP